MDNKINEWLQECSIINEIAQLEDIHHEELTDNVKNLALQRAGSESIPLKYTTDKGWKKQYQYMLLLKSESEDDVQRLNNLDWLDDLEDWIETQNKNKNYPILEDDKIVEKISVANSLTYQTSEDGSISVYSLQLFFDIRKMDFTINSSSL